MQVLNWLVFQPLLPDVEPLNTRLQDVHLFAIQALCTAGSRKVASRAEIFKVMIQGTDSPLSRHFLSTLTCFQAGNGRDIVQ